MSSFTNEDRVNSQAGTLTIHGNVYHAPVHYQ